MLNKEWLMSELLTTMGIVLYAAEWFLICLVLFSLLTFLFKDLRTQPLFRPTQGTDMLYWFLGPLFYRPVGFIMSSALMLALYSSDTIKTLHEQGLPPLGTLPLWLQIILILLISDFLQYWIHRFFHQERFWKFHAVHHSSTIVDWLSSARFHPVNIIFYTVLTGAVAVALGFSPKAFASLVIFNNLFSAFVHTNVKWTYGPLRYVFVSPVFHRWHHTQEGGNMNFAQTFAFMDLAFGTFYMPEGQSPQSFGAPHDPIPETLMGQLIYPFRRKTANPSNVVPSSY